MIVVDRTLSVVDGRYQLDVHTLTLKPDSFEVEYSITPPLSRSGDDVVLVRVAATDERGRTYGENMSGDTWSLSEDGLSTVGTAYVQPGFPVDVREATLRMVFIWEGLETEYEVPVNLETRTLNDG
jgi:hypothetical protein